MKHVDGVFTHYVGRQFLIRFLGLLAFFVIILQMLDLLNKSSDIMAPDGAGWESVARYIALRTPQIFSQFAPFAALLGIVITLTVLNHTSEITIMRAAGMSVHRVLFPIGFVCLLIAVGHFIFHETVVIKTTEKLAYWEANNFTVDLPSDTGTRTNVRLSYDSEFISIGSAAQLENGARLTDVTIYELDENGLTGGVVEAARAIYDNGVWTLFDVTSLDATTLETVKSPTLRWSTALDPDLLFALSLDPDKTSLPDLVRKISQLDDDGADTRAATTSLLGRFSKPMATLVMPLLGAMAGFGVRRQGNQLARAVMGAALGFAYFVAENLMLAFGKLGVAPAMLGAFFPFALFMVVGFSILLAMEN